MDNGSTVQVYSAAVPWQQGEREDTTRDGPQHSGLCPCVAHPRRHLPPLLKTLGSSEIQPQSPIRVAIIQTETERAYDQAHLREGCASTIGGEMELLIAR
jgi:hypothetical protein